MTHYVPIIEQLETWARALEGDTPGAARGVIVGMREVAADLTRESRPAPAARPGRQLTAGQLLDIVQRAKSVIEEEEGADEHYDLLRDLEAVQELVSGEIGASHMGCGAEVVLIERGDV